MNIHLDNFEKSDLTDVSLDLCFVEDVLDVIGNEIAMEDMPEDQKAFIRWQDRLYGLVGCLHSQVSLIRSAVEHIEIKSLKA